MSTSVAGVSSSTSNNELHPDGPRNDLDDLVIFFNYRSLFEADCLDTANCESWKEVLEGFGYSKFTRIGFLRELSLATPAEVMQSLCPYTTKSEWGPVLNKRHVRLEREIKALCQVEMLPLQGLKDFLISCAKGCRNLTTVFLSPFSETCTRVLLEQAELMTFVDLVHCYTEREFAMLEALEMLNLPPPTLPDYLNNRWEPSEDGTKQGIMPNPEIVKTRMVAFESDPQGVATAIEFGVAPIGVSFNCFEEHVHTGAMGLSPEKKSSLDTTVYAATAGGGEVTGSPLKKAVASYACHIEVDEDDDDEGEISDYEEEEVEAAAGKQVSPHVSPSRHHQDAVSPHNSTRRGSHAKAEEGMRGHLQDAEDGGSSVGTKGDATLLDCGCVTVVRDFVALKYEYLPHMLPAPRMAYAKGSTH